MAEGSGDDGGERAEERWLPSPHPRTEPADASADPFGDPVPLPRRHTGAKITRRTFVALLSVIAFTATGIAYLTYDNLKSNVHTTDALGTGEDTGSPPADDGATDILLVGTDSRSDMQGNPLPPSMLKSLRTEEKAGINTDTIIVLRLPKDGGKPSGISIPRDSWVTVPGGGEAKINSAFGTAKTEAAAKLRNTGETDQAKIERDSDQEGRRALIKTVQDFTQIRVDHYAEVSLLGFYLLTEALGGVQVCLKQATEDKDSGANFKAGVQTVSGGEALSFVRQRKNLPHGDLDRIVRQQAFLSSALHQVLSAGTLTSPTKLGQLTDAVHRSIVLDPDLDILKFAEQAKGIASGDVGFKTIPVVTINGRSPDGTQSIVQIDPPTVQQYVASLVGRAPAPPVQPPTGGGGAPGGGPAPARPVAGVTAPPGVTCVY
ncbi:LCP family protein [Amycolatopsis minnesotensis]|uniref:LCP family protein n=1 Tax=Amycolatopsis minnesotensis TaxID=337894 RepID=A0ABN2SLQ8_9PSEU